MKRTTFLLIALFSLGPFMSACANTQTHVIQGVYTLDSAFAAMQEVTIAVLDSGALSPGAKVAVKEADHALSEEIKSITDRAIALENGKNVSLSLSDIKEASSNLASFRNMIDGMKKDFSSTANNNPTGK